MSESPVLFIGHPFAPIGKGQELRSNLRALLSLEEPARCLDAYRHSPRRDREHCDLVLPLETDALDAPVRIFHLNGDEVEPVLRHLRMDELRFRQARNVIVPAWELPCFPEVWAEQLRRFDEIWAISHFVAEGLTAAGLESHPVGQSVECPPGPLLSRRGFGIRDSAFVFLTLADTSSYLSRKNPEASIRIFAKLCEERPHDDLQLVVKVKGAEGGAGALPFEIPLPPDRFVLIDEVLSEQQQRSLIAQSDCLLSLHRAEGFGRSLGEAMGLGCLALGTGWSGNMDFMTEANALPVRYELVEVGAEEYPHGNGQEWAEPDEEHALHQALRALDDQRGMERMRRLARADIMTRTGHRAVGLRMLERIRALAPTSHE